MKVALNYDASFAQQVLLLTPLKSCRVCKIKLYFPCFYNCQAYYTKLVLCDYSVAMVNFIGRSIGKYIDNTTRFVLQPKPRVNFTNVLRAAFALVDPKKAKKDSQVKQFFCAFGICKRKSCL